MSEKYLFKVHATHSTFVLSKNSWMANAEEDVDGSCESGCRSPFLLDCLWRLGSYFLFIEAKISQL